MVASVRRHLGFDDGQVETALRVALERGRLKAVGDPVHSISLIYDWAEE